MNVSCTSKTQISIFRWTSRPYLFVCFKPQYYRLTFICKIASYVNSLNLEWAQDSIHLILSRILLFILSAKPFCCGVILIVLCLAIPLSLQYPINSPSRYSKQLLFLILLKNFPICFSTSAFHYIYVLKAWFLCLSIYIHTLLKNSS